MKVTISGGSYTDEHRAVYREIVETLRRRGISVDMVQLLPHDRAHEVVLRRMAAEGVPVSVEVLPAYDVEAHRTRRML